MFNFSLGYSRSKKVKKILKNVGQNILFRCKKFQINRSYSRKIKNDSLFHVLKGVYPLNIFIQFHIRMLVITIV